MVKSETLHAIEQGICPCCKYHWDAENSCCCGCGATIEYIGNLMKLTIPAEGVAFIKMEREDV